MAHVHDTETPTKWMRANGRKGTKPETIKATT